MKNTFHRDDFPGLDDVLMAEIFGKLKTAKREKLVAFSHHVDIAGGLFFDPLPTGAKSFAKKWLINRMTNKWDNPLNVKQILKGNAMENAAIDLLGEIDNKFYTKNLKRFENHHLKGVPDIIATDEIIDIKLPWDVNSMPYFEELNSLYWWQMQAYMNLTDKPSARVVYMLVDAPEHLIQSEIKRAEWNGLPTNEIRKNLTFEDLPIDMRVVQYRVHRDDDAIESIKRRVEDIRVYIEGLKQELTTGGIRIAKSPVK